MHGCYPQTLAKSTNQLQSLWQLRIMVVCFLVSWCRARRFLWQFRRLHFVRITSQTASKNSTASWLRDKVFASISRFNNELWAYTPFIKGVCWLVKNIKIRLLKKRHGNSSALLLPRVLSNGLLSLEVKPYFSIAASISCSDAMFYWREESLGSYDRYMSWEVPVF